MSVGDDVQWSEAASNCVRYLVTEIIEQGLVLPDFERDFRWTTDFSYNGLGGMLSQSYFDENGKVMEYPIMFYSQVLTTHERNYSPTEGEALAIIFSLKRFAHILYGMHVIIRTDHRPL